MERKGREGLYSMQSFKDSGSFCLPFLESSPGLTEFSPSRGKKKIMKDWAGSVIGQA